MDRSRTRLAYAILLLTLAGQLIWWQGGQLPPLSGPSVGDSLPDVKGTVLGGPGHYLSLNDAVRASGKCGVVYAMTIHCPFCSRMRSTWPRQLSAWLDSTDVDVAVTWLMLDEPDGIEAWLDGYYLPDVTVLVPDRVAPVVRRLGILGTPTSYLVDSAGTVLAGAMGPRLPPSAIAREACRSGPD